MAVAAAALWLVSRDREPVSVEGQQPADLKTAFTFAALYVVVLFAVAYAKERAGTRGLYLVSALSGLTDVDAITLVRRAPGRIGADRSRAGLAPDRGGAALQPGVQGRDGRHARAIARLRRWILLLFGLQLLAGAAVLAFWPS